MLYLMRDADERPSVAPRYTPYASPVAPELGRAFAEACRRDTPQATESLRLATVAMVERLKADDLPPERVLIAVKTALVRYGGCHLPPTFDDDGDTKVDEQRATIYRRLFGWCIDAYYGTQ